MNTIDLHIHSNKSNDGELIPMEIFNKCLENEIEILSLTDHNTVAGIYEINQIVIPDDVTFVPGIEIDCIFNGIDLHLLGYNINYESNDFKDLAIDYTDKVMEALPVMIEKLQKLGFVIDIDEILLKSEGKLPSGEFIAEVMITGQKDQKDKLLPYIKGGLRSGMPYINFYYDFFAQGKPAYVKIDFMDFDKAIQLIMDNRGIPVIAHPGLNFKGQEQIITKLVQKGAKGIEVFNNYHNSIQADYFAGISIKENLLITGGSDFHGKNKPLIQVGKYNVNNKYYDYFIQSVNKLAYGNGI